MIAGSTIGCRGAGIVAAIREGRLQPKKRREVFGYHGIVVELAALEGIQEQKTAAAAFARSIGLREYAAFTALIDAGHVLLSVLVELRFSLPWPMRIVRPRSGVRDERLPYSVLAQVQHSPR